jgi:hypothetical protein
MESVFSSYRSRGVEACCLWYGPKSDVGELNITALIIPKQINRIGSFHLTGEAIGEVADATRPLGLIARAQVHTHPGSCVGHSFYDDENVISRRVLSIVLPDYGRPIVDWPSEVGVHALTNDAWEQLSDIAADGCFHFDDTELRTIDLR